MTNNGIHQVPIAQKNSVNPLRNGRIPGRNTERSALSIKVAPAKVVIATAPILIQYGGVKSSGDRGQNKQRYKIRAIIMLYHMQPSRYMLRVKNHTRSTSPNPGHTRVPGVDTACVATTASSHARLIPLAR